jgi:integrase
VTAARLCEGCGRKPQAYHGRRFCYDCKPGSKGRPRPCRRCGSTTDYWTAGLCRRCHQYAPQLPEACRECLAWGVRRTQKWLCFSCIEWRRRYPGVAACISCGRELTISPHGACRLCWHQAKMLQPYLGRGLRGPLDILGANRHGQQLFLANMAFYNRGPGPYKRVPRPALAREPGPPPRDPNQPDLFTRDPVIEAARSHGVPDPPDSRLALRLDTAVREHAERHGWLGRNTHAIRVAMRVLLGIRATATLPIQATEIQQLTPLGLRVRLVRAVLAGAGLLDDDRIEHVDAWFPARISDLPPAMADELRAWFTVLRHGSTTPPRSRPRSPATIKTRTRWVLPTLRTWAAEGHQSLREITREQILAVLPAAGTPRATLGGALRSIFGTLKAHRVIFTNPMARITVGNFTRRTPLPLDHHQLRDLLNSPDVAGAALVALLIFHGLRPDELRDLKLTDVRDNRLHLADRVVPMAEPVQQRLAAYLEHRCRRWPGSANSHFFIHTRSAPTTQAVTHYWVNDRLGMPAFLIRQHRIVDEVLATAGDLRRICDFFGVTMATAQHYASVLNHPGLANVDTGSGTQ